MDSEYKEELKGMIGFYGSLIALFGFYALVGSIDVAPKVQGQKPVVREERICVGSWGYDTDKDGKLDFAKEWCVSRAGTFCHNLRPSDLEFRALQRKYDSERTQK
ncbi:MAG: hypothetical protein WC796_05920 [Candidatus Pacearchaeota archaeon]|jgi:hypothetical protein